MMGRGIFPRLTLDMPAWYELSYDADLRDQI
jgi:hypothetical protein